MFHFDFGLSNDLINVLSNSLAWCAVIVLTIFVYKKQEHRPNVWKAILVVLIGLFSFTITIMPEVKIPILPLGVWLLYWYFRNKGDRWQVYRKFAWLGFGANFVFLIFTLVQPPIHHYVYPPNQLSTYISNTENATITAIHPSAQEITLKKDQLIEQVSAATLEEIKPIEWYNEMTDSMPEPPIERFPYILGGVRPEWGSGMGSLIYLEKDGKGILVTTPEKQYYFHLQNSVIKGSL